MRFYGKPYCMLDYGLPRLLTKSRNDKVADTLIPRHCEQSEAIHNLAQSGFRYLSLQGANEMRNEAIYNFAHFVFHLVIARGISLVAIHNPKSRLFLLDSLFDLLQVHYYRLLRIFVKCSQGHTESHLFARTQWQIRNHRKNL